MPAPDSGYDGLRMIVGISSQRAGFTREPLFSHDLGFVVFSIRFYSHQSHASAGLDLVALINQKDSYLPDRRGLAAAKAFSPDGLADGDPARPDSGEQLRCQSASPFLSVNSLILNDISHRKNF